MKMIENKDKILPDLMKKYQAGASLKELAWEYNISQGTIANWLRASGVKIRGNGVRRIELDIEKLKEMADQGISAKEMAREFYVSAHIVCTRMAENGIKINKEARRECQKRYTHDVMKGSIDSLPPRTQLQKKCRSCVYRAGANAVNGCNYAFITDLCRLQSAEECTFYEKGKRIDPKSALATKKRLEEWARRGRLKMAAGGAK